MPLMLLEDKDKLKYSGIIPGLFWLSIFKA